MDINITIVNYLSRSQMKLCNYLIYLGINFNNLPVGQNVASRCIKETKFMMLQTYWVLMLPLILLLLCAAKLHEFYHFLPSPREGQGEKLGA